MLRCVVVLLCLAGPTFGQTQADRQAIQGTIAGQIEAFKHDDAQAAFGFAAPAVHDKFGTAEIFMEIVRRAYRPVYRPRGVVYGSATQMGDHVLQRVEVIGPDGRAYQALYYMIQGTDGVWRIDACELTESLAVGA
jgi:hypothetical protein